MSDQPKDKAREIQEQRELSASWMSSSYWTEWERVYKDYGCNVDQPLDSQGNVDPDRTAVGMPDTFALVNRRVARVTAQLPNIGFVSSSGDKELERRVSRKVMHDWDIGRVQRWQKKHVRQAELFGWSVRAWSWEVDRFDRQKRIEITRGVGPDEQRLIRRQYSLGLDVDLNDPRVLAQIQDEFGRGGLLPVTYEYLAYEGPRSEVLFSGDCYPEPEFESIQTSNWFIIERRRNRKWLMDLAERYPEMRPGIVNLLEKHPKGTQSRQAANGVDFLRDRLRNAVGRPSSLEANAGLNVGTGFWTITERHSPGRKPKLAYVAEDRFYLGEMDYPYVLDGKIAFTELIHIDDILGGCGDSVARIVRGLQLMHNNTVNRRYDLIRHLSEPLIGTTDRHLYENPDLLKRDGMRLVLMRNGPGSLWTQPEQAAQAAVVSAMNEEGATLRLIQMASGDNNMSMAANVDPSQSRTATGARLMAYNQDVLTKDLTDMFHQTSVVEDCEMLYLFNRSEMSERRRFEASRYERNYEEMSGEQQEWITAEPLDFQADGRVVVEIGSTLADDDEANVTKANNLFGLLAQDPTVNHEKLVTDLLVAYGKGREIRAYKAQPQPPPPPQAKASMSIASRWELCTPAEKAVFLQMAGVPPEAMDQAEMAVDQKAQAMAEPPPPPPPPQSALGAIG